MKTSFIDIALITPQLKIGAIKENAKIISSLVNNQSKDIDTFIFPELSLVGYTVSDNIFSLDILNNIEPALKTILEETKNKEAIIIIGSPLVYNTKIYSVAVVIQKGKLIGIVPKSYLPNYLEFYESRQWTSGINIKNETIFLCNQEVPFGVDLLFVSKLYKFGIELCEDMFVSKAPSIDLARSGAEIIYNLSASPEQALKHEYRKSLIIASSGRLQAGYVYCSSGISESNSDLVFCGARIVAVNGEISTESLLFEEGITFSQIDIEQIKSFRLKHHFEIVRGKNRRQSFDILPRQEEEIKHYLISKTPYLKYPVDKYLKAIFELQVQALTSRLKYLHCNAVIGISGGLDSTLALLVSIEAYKRLNKPLSELVAITMPTNNTSKRTLSNVRELAASLNISINTIDIQNLVDLQQQSLNHYDLDVVYENIQARIRTEILMNLSNKHHGIVVGTGDLSEIALGWNTYNGDHMAMYNVNCSVLKSLIPLMLLQLSENNSKLTEVVKKIIKTPISPELLPEHAGQLQGTEAILGPYSIHDFIIYYYLKYGYTKQKILILAKELFIDTYNVELIIKTVNTFFKRFFNNQFKRNVFPDGVKATELSLSPRGDYRSASDGSFLSDLD